MNLVLDEAEEVDVKTKERKEIGRILLKGDTITLMQEAARITVSLVERVKIAEGTRDHFNRPSTNFNRVLDAGTLGLERREPLALSRARCMVGSHGVGTRGLLRALPMCRVRQH